MEDSPDLFHRYDSWNSVFTPTPDTTHYHLRKDFVAIGPPCIMRLNTAMVFVDAQNLMHGKNEYDSDLELDLLDLKDELAGDHDLVRAYWFDSYFTKEQIQRSEKDDDRKTLSDKSNFFYMLDVNGYRVDKKPLRDRDGTFVEKGADIGLATEMIAQGFNDCYDVAIVVTGDDDFSRSIRYVQDQGKVVKVAAFEASLSSNLRKVADDCIELDAIADDLAR